MFQNLFTGQQRNSFGAPDGFEMIHANPGFLGSHGRTEFENLEVPRFDEVFEGLPVDGTATGRPMIAGRVFHIVHVESKEALVHGLKVETVADKPEVLLDLSVAGVVPVDNGWIAKLFEEKIEVAFEGDFLE